MTERALMLARLASTPVMLRELTSDVTADQASKPPRPGEWSIVEVVRHLVEGDRDTFLPRQTGERLGVSGFLDPISLLQYATHAADHDIEHLAQMAQARATALAAG